MKQDHHTTGPIDGHVYRVSRMNAMDQFHITRRLMPLLASMGISAAQLKSLGKEEGGSELMALVGPAMGTLSAMDNDTAEFIINTCLTAVERSDAEGRFAKVMVGGRFMFEDIDMMVMLQLTYEVCRFNLAGFSKGLNGLINSLGPSAPKSTQ